MNSKKFGLATFASFLLVFASMGLTACKTGGGGDHSNSGGSSSSSSSSSSSGGGSSSSSSSGGSSSSSGSSSGSGGTKSVLSSDFVQQLVTTVPMSSGFQFWGTPVVRQNGATTSKFLVSLQIDVDQDGQTATTTKLVSASNSPDSVAIPVGTNERLYGDSSDPMVILVRAYASKPASVAHEDHTYVTPRAVIDRIMQKARFAAPGMTYQVQTNDLADATDADGALLFYATVTNGRVDVNVDLSTFTTSTTPYLEWQLNYPKNATSKIYTLIKVATDGTAGRSGAIDTGSNPQSMDATGIADGPLTVAEPTTP